MSLIRFWIWGESYCLSLSSWVGSAIRCGGILFALKEINNPKTSLQGPYACEYSLQILYIFLYEYSKSYFDDQKDIVVTLLVIKKYS